MLANASVALMVGFAVVTVVVLGFAYAAVRVAAPRRAPAFALGAIAWLTLLGVLAARGFFLEVEAMPPRLVVAIAPPMLAIVGLFVTARGRRFLDALPLRTLTYLHVTRIGVELVLFALAASRLVPEMVTFAGRNFDVAAGLTAPIVAYLVLDRGVLSRRWLVVWNLGALALLLHVVTLAILSAPLPFQQLNLDQPMRAVLGFPFVWLPGVVVPIVALSHLAALRRLARPCGADLPACQGPADPAMVGRAELQDSARGRL